ncbi:hypothetical protein [Nubsella zeaxanthinifaciens]|uniref:hypothetical protein n=1 Tax=Nubsella zeaxanthinifaciens TaxID=392412 RepID=UPI0013008E0A|nr:hypothetical protein [Nubsella zeaxanthinifaciens]
MRQTLNMVKDIIMKDNKNEALSSKGIDQENINRMHNTYSDGTSKKPAEEDTSREIIDAHDERNNDEGADEQFGGDAEDNRDRRKGGGRLDEL